MKGKWISVKDKLPPENELVAVIRQSRYCEILIAKRIVFNSYLGMKKVGCAELWVTQNGSSRINQITHWTSLPELPNMEDTKD